MAKMNIGAGAIDSRLKKLSKAFGSDSQILKTAQDYIESRVDERFIKRAKKDIFDKEGNLIFEKGDVTGIRQIKDKYTEVDDPKYGKVIQIEKGTPSPEAIFGRSQVMDEYLPTVESIYKRELEAYKEELADRVGPPTLLDQKILTEKSTKVIKDPKVEVFLANRASKIAEDLASMDEDSGIVDELYQVLNNDEKLTEDVPYFTSSAESLLNTREKTAAWVREARKLIREYTDKAEARDRQEY